MTMWNGARPCAIIFVLAATTLLGSPTWADTPDCMNGQWKDNGGGTLQLNWTGTELAGNGTGGAGHEALRSQYALKQVNGNTFTGTWTVQEGVVKGSGTATIVMNGGDGNGLQLTYEDDWTGGGTGGHASGQSEMTRVTGRACR